MSVNLMLIHNEDIQEQDAEKNITPKRDEVAV